MKINDFNFSNLVTWLSRLSIGDCFFYDGMIYCLSDIMRGTYVCHSGIRVFGFSKNVRVHKQIP